MSTFIHAGAPLNAGEYSRYIVRRAPTVLENVQTELSCAVDVGVEHLADEFDAWWLVRVLFLEMHH